MRQTRESIPGGFCNPEAPKLTPVTQAANLACARGLAKHQHPGIGDREEYKHGLNPLFLACVQVHKTDPSQDVPGCYTFMLHQLNIKSQLRLAKE